MAKETPNRETTRRTQDINSNTQLFDAKNYFIIIGGLVTVLIGFFLMSGGAMPDANTWDESLIYSPRRITVAPFVVLLGLGIVIIGIFKDFGHNNEEVES